MDVIIKSVRTRGPEAKDFNKKVMKCKMMITITRVV